MRDTNIHTHTHTHTNAQTTGPQILTLAQHAILCARASTWRLRQCITVTGRTHRRRLTATGRQAEATNTHTHAREATKLTMCNTGNTSSQISEHTSARQNNLVSRSSDVASLVLGAKICAEIELDLGALARHPTHTRHPQAHAHASTTLLICECIEIEILLCFDAACFANSDTCIYPARRTRARALKQNSCCWTDRLVKARALSRRRSRAAQSCGSIGSYAHIRNSI